MATLDIKYDCNPTDGTPGEKFERFEIDAMNAASKADKRGYTIAETWLGTDEGPQSGATSIHPLLVAPAHSTHTRAPCVGGHAHGARGP